MKIYKYKEFDVHAGDTRVIDLLDPAGSEAIASGYPERFFNGREEFRRYIELYGRLYNLDKFAILNSHGWQDERGSWVFDDEGKQSYVQGWINKLDGMYSALLFNTCNTGSRVPKSKVSILMIPDHDIDMRIREPVFSFIVPEIGEIDLYTIGNSINSLEQRLRLAGK